MAGDKEGLFEQLKEAGKKLLVPPSSIDELLPLLDQAEYYLSKVEQSFDESMQDALSPLTKALATVELLRHPNVDVKVAVASCISEITRITAPDAPYDDDKMKDVFQLLVSSFENLPDKSSRSFNKRVLILETVAKVRSCVVMLDLECDALIVEMFQIFLGTIRDYHSENIFSSMETIMTLVLEESEDVSPELLTPLLACVKKDKKGVLSVAVQLAEKVFRSCADKLRPYLRQAIISLGTAVNDYSRVVTSICQENPVVNHHDEMPPNEPVVLEDNPAPAPADEAPEAQAPEIQVAEPLENNIQENDAAPEVNISPPRTMNNGVDGSGNVKDTTSPVRGSSVNADEQIVSDLPSEDQVATKPVTHDSEPGNTTSLESKVEKAAKKKGRKSKPSTTISESAEASHVANEKETEGHLDDNEDKHVKVLHDSSRKDTAGEAATGVEENTAADLSSSKALDAEVERITSPSVSGSLPDESRPKKASRPKKKDSVGQEDLPLKNAAEVTKDLEAKPKKGKKASTDSVNDDKMLADVEISKSGGGTSDSGVKERTDKVEGGSNVEDVSSLQKNKDSRKRGRGKVALEMEKSKSHHKYDPKLMHSPKSLAKSAKDESFQDESVGTSSKRKRSSGKDKEKASEELEYGDNLVGCRVKVYWPKDEVFYEGVIDSFDPSNKKHKVLYDDGDEEILNLQKERWELIDDLAASEEEAPKPANPDSESEIQKRKKAKTTPEPPAKSGKTQVSSEGETVSSGKFKSGAKSGRKLKDDGNEPKSKDKSSKLTAKSEDQHSGKSTAHSPKTIIESKDNDFTSSKSKSKQENLKVTSKALQDSPKIGTKSKGKTTGGDLSVNGTGKAKHSSLKSKDYGDLKEKHHEKSSLSSKTPEGIKAKSSESKARESEGLSSKKRRRAG